MATIVIFIVDIKHVAAISTFQWPLTIENLAEARRKKNGIPQFGSLASYHRSFLIWACTLALLLILLPNSEWEATADYLKMHV